MRFLPHFTMGGDWTIDNNCKVSKQSDPEKTRSSRSSCAFPEVYEMEAVEIGGLEVSCVFLCIFEFLVVVFADVLLETWGVNFRDVSL